MTEAALVAETALATNLASLVSEQLGTAVQIVNLRRLTGGSSHETWSFDVLRDQRSAQPLRYVLRREFARSSINSRLDVEFALLRVLSELGQPVARPAWCALNDVRFGTPCMLMERVTGVDLRKYLAARGSAIDRPALGRALARQQAALHAIPLQALAEVLPPRAAHSTLQELAQWTALLERGGGSKSRPLLAAAQQWLQANAPVPDRCGLVHGDFKTNNLILSDAERCVILDWEMAHLGDPVEDLAWTLLWTTRDDLVEGLLPRAEYLAAYAQASGVTLDPQRLFYWEVFARVKLAAIFCGGAQVAADGPPLRLFDALLGRALPVLERDLAQMLASCVIGNRP